MAWKKKQPTLDEVRTRVHKGITRLNSFDPEWYKRVNLETLEMWRGCHCVLGQVYKRFLLGIDRLELKIIGASTEVADHGFDVYGNELSIAQTYDILDYVWKEEITALLNTKENPK